MNACANAFQKESPPKTMIMDNGTEFQGPFEELLHMNNVEIKKTLPYTPQQNGKIERWWDIIERKKTQPLRGEYIDWLVDQYNSKWEHSSLMILTGQRTTPQEAFQSITQVSKMQTSFSVNKN
ncbi:Integrase core domain containing protein [Histomonas meleagridis]|uniref:Integrase core domain containing protein n=1 Tax=Histomonas meleagridis TaxID=135588 RepID=UPI003559ADEB|nr:Integrase core domain containing protein [Histomonas meleagridis]KAH0801039.1 Integrase core domain containing protein [Histomonas meleagridis]